MSLDDEQVRITVNLRKLRLLLDRIMHVVDSVQEMDKAVMDLVEDIAPEITQVIREHDERQDEIKEVLANVEIPDNVIPFIKKGDKHEPPELG